MTIPFVKPAISIQDQLNKLIFRGLIVADHNAAMQKLKSISYYRLSGYIYPFRLRDHLGNVQDGLVAGTKFEQILELYEFDRHLRLLILDAIERIEVAIRTQLTYNFSCKYGPFGHTDASNFHHDFNHPVWITEVDKETQRSGDEFIRHYSHKYDGYPTVPLWMLTEVMSLGGLSHLYKGLKHDDKKVVSSFFNVHHKRLVDWLHKLTYIRNVCAHHSRLWNRELAVRPDVVKDVNWQKPITPRNDRIFYILLILRYLLLATGNGKEWVLEVNQLLNPIANNPKWRIAMGIPENWETHPIWSL
jgi:abortive infection bacteriophage resistance protein